MAVLSPAVSPFGTRRPGTPIAEGGKGLSQRQAAKVLGVSHIQVQNDVATKVAKKWQQSCHPIPQGWAARHSAKLSYSGAALP
jgi:hypothetical protein